MGGREGVTAEKRWRGEKRGWRRGDSELRGLCEGERERERGKLCRRGGGRRG